MPSSIELVVMLLAAGGDDATAPVVDALLASADELDAPTRRAVAILIGNQRGAERAADVARLAEEVLGAFGSAAQPPLAGRIAAFPRLARVIDALPADRRQPLVGPARFTPPRPLPQIPFPAGGGDPDK